MAQSFPTDVQEFDADDRISFSKLDNKFIAVHDDGSEFEFDADSKLWAPVDDLDDNAHEYGGERSSTTPVDDAASRKRKNGSDQVSKHPACLNTRPEMLMILSQAREWEAPTEQEAKGSSPTKTKHSRLRDRPSDRHQR